MNCKHVEELLPLFVGRDLEEERALLVITHVRSCTQCARSAKEHSEASQLLQLFEPPQFSEAAYTAVRSRVLREIERESSAPHSIFALEFLRRSFRPHAMWAVSTAVLIAVCAFAYYFIANRTSEQRNRLQLAENRGTGQQNTRDEQANLESKDDSVKPLPSPSSKDDKPDRTGTPGASPALATNSLKPRLNQTHSRRAGESSTPAGLSGRGPRPPAVTVGLAQYSPVESKDPTPNSSISSDKTLRLEIQTSDRNIRIIWFSHPRTNEGSPNESSKGI